MNNEWEGPMEIAEIIFEVAESAEGGYEARHWAAASLHRETTGMT